LFRFHAQARHFHYEIAPVSQDQFFVRRGARRARRARRQPAEAAATLPSLAAAAARGSQPLRLER
jgi:hypothetical protein